MSDAGVPIDLDDPPVARQRTRNQNHLYGWLIIGMCWVVAILAVVVRETLPPGPTITATSTTTGVALIPGHTMSATVEPDGSIRLTIGIENPTKVSITASNPRVTVTPALGPVRARLVIGTAEQVLDQPTAWSSSATSLIVPGGGQAVLAVTFKLDCASFRAGKAKLLRATVTATVGHSPSTDLDLTPDVATINALIWQNACKT